MHNSHIPLQPVPVPVASAVLTDNSRLNPRAALALASGPLHRFVPLPTWVEQPVWNILPAILLAASWSPAAPSAWLGPAPTGTVYPAGEEDRQFAMLARDLQQRPHFQSVEKETFRSEALIRDADRDPLDLQSLL